MFILCDSSIPQESPRWLLSVGREEDARKALKKMAAINGKELPADLNLEENKAKVGRKINTPLLGQLYCHCNCALSYKLYWVNMAIQACTYSVKRAYQEC